MLRLRCDINVAMQRISSRIFLRRSYVTRTKNLYEILGLNRNSTAVSKNLIYFCLAFYILVLFKGEIKAAYYKLSMMHHPDKNVDNEFAAEKFREITEAYEVLGNFRLRKLYDKGIINTAGEKYAQKQPSHEEEENDPTTRFYKARMKKEHATATGRTPIYDFDEWTQNHYGKSFEQQQRLKTKTRTTERKTVENKHSSQKELIVGVVVVLIIIAMMMGNAGGNDVDRLKDKKKET
jgi:DnaJ homolog subfamily C member 30